MVQQRGHVMSVCLAKQMYQTMQSRSEEGITHNPLLKIQGTIIFFEKKMDVCDGIIPYIDM